MENDQHPGGNTGFIEVIPAPTQFVAGAETGILDNPVMQSSDWRPYLPTNAAQLMKTSDGISRGDTNACVSFGEEQAVETIMNFQVKTAVISPDDTAWLHTNGYFDANGSILLSKRFRAKMSGTDPNYGNTLPNVWGSAHRDGCVPDSLWPMPTSEFDAFVAHNGGMTQQQGWAIYYANVPQEVIDLGKEFAARFPILYEWIVTPALPAAEPQLLAFLKVSPVEIATAVCPGWNTDDPIKACGAGTQHATMLSFVEANGDYDILDHYVPFQKRFAPGYNITYGMRGVVGQVPAPIPASFHHTFTQQLTFGGTANDPAELRALQQALQFLVSPVTKKPYMTSGAFGRFGPMTKAALAAFQTDRGIKDIDGQGSDFGPASRAAMNASLAAKN